MALFFGVARRNRLSFGMHAKSSLFLDPCICMQKSSLFLDPCICMQKSSLFLDPCIWAGFVDSWVRINDFARFGGQLWYNAS